MRGFTVPSVPLCTAGDLRDLRGICCSPSPGHCGWASRTPPSASLMVFSRGHGNLLTQPGCAGSQPKGGGGLVVCTKPTEAVLGQASRALRSSWWRQRDVDTSQGSGAGPKVAQSARASRIFCPRRTHVDAWLTLTTRAHFLLVFISYMNVHTQWWRWSFTFLF